MGIDAQHRGLVSKMLALALLIAAAPSSGMIVTPLDKARFEPVSASQPDGPQIAILSGDPATGPSSMLMRMPRGGGRLHIHSADYHLALIEGEMKHWGTDGNEAGAAPIGPGGTWFQPGGEAHADSCLSDTCLMYIQWSGARDARLPPGAK